MREVGNSEELSERLNKHRYEKRRNKNKVLEEGTRDEVQQRARKRLPKKRMHEERGGR